MSEFHETTKALLEACQRWYNLTNAVGVHSYVEGALAVSRDPLMLARARDRARGSHNGAPQRILSDLIEIAGRFPAMEDVGPVFELMTMDRPDFDIARGAILAAPNPDTLRNVAKELGANDTSGWLGALANLLEDEHLPF